MEEPPQLVGGGSMVQPKPHSDRTVSNALSLEGEGTISGRVQPQGTTPGYNLRVQPQGTTSGYNLRVQPQGTTSGYNLRVQPQGTTSGYNLRVQPQGTISGYNLRVISCIINASY